MPDLPESGAWQRTSPFAIVFFVGTTARKIIDGYGQVAATVGVTAFLLRNPEYAALVITIGSVALLTVAFLRYWCFRFRIDEDRILIREGVLRRKALDLPFSRIQGVNIQRRLSERVLGLVTVVLDTPGSIAAEGQLRTVKPEVADQLLAKVAAHRHGLVAGSPPTVTEAPLDSGERPSVAGEAPAAVTDRHRFQGQGRVLQTLTPADLFRMGLAHPRGLFLLVLLAFLGSRSDWAKDTTLKAFGVARNAVGGLGALETMLVATGVVLGCVVLSRAGGVAATVLKYHRFTLWREGRSYRTRAGLLTQKEVVVKVRKIQMLRLYQNLVERYYRRYRLETPPIGGSLDEDDDELKGLDAEVLQVPWADDARVEEMRSGVFRGEGGQLALLPNDKAFKRVSSQYIRLSALRFLILGWAVGVLFFYVSTYIWMTYVGPDALAPEDYIRLLRGLGIAALVWGGVCLVTALPIGWLRWRQHGYMHDDDGIVCRSGLIGYKVWACLFRKTQAVTVKQSPLQRRHGLATLDVETATGSVTVPYIDHGVACRLRDYTLYRAESSERHWY